MYCSLINFCRSLLGFCTEMFKTSSRWVSCSVTKYTRSVRSCVTNLVINHQLAVMNLFARHVLNTASLQYYNDNITLTSSSMLCRALSRNGIIVRLRQDQFLWQKRLLIQRLQLPPWKYNSTQDASSILCWWKAWQSLFNEVQSLFEAHLHHRHLVETCIPFKFLFKRFGGKKIFVPEKYRPLLV